MCVRSEALVIARGGLSALRLARALARFRNYDEHHSGEHLFYYWGASAVVFVMIELGKINLPCHINVGPNELVTIFELLFISRDLDLLVVDCVNPALAALGSQAANRIDKLTILRILHV